MNRKVNSSQSIFLYTNNVYDFFTFYRFRYRPEFSPITIYTEMSRKRNGRQEAKRADVKNLEKNEFEKQNCIKIVEVGDGTLSVNLLPSLLAYKWCV